MPVDHEMSDGERQARRTYGLDDRGLPPVSGLAGPGDSPIAGAVSDDPFEHLPSGEEPIYLRILDDDFREIGPIDAVSELYSALARAQATFPPIPKNRTAKIQPREGRGAAYTFDYADLDTVVSATRPSLTREGIAVSTPANQIKEGVLKLRTIVARGSARLVSITHFTYQGDAKMMAAAITYQRRYAYQGILNVSADVDADELPGPNDAAGSGGPRERLQGGEAPERSASERPGARAPQTSRSEPPPVPSNARNGSDGPPTEVQKGEIQAHMRRLRWDGPRVAREFKAFSGVNVQSMTEDTAGAFLRKLATEKAP